MKFCLGLPRFLDPDDPDPYRQTYELAQFIEDLGYEGLFMGHHSFTPEFNMAAPFTFLAAVAAQTSKIKLGTGIYLLPLHHPVAVAEQVAALDHVSNGRAILGVGVGYRKYEFEGFGVDYHTRGARMNEQLEIIRQAWTTGNLEYHGKHFDIPDLKTDPMCIQKPHVPIWIGAVARKAQERAAKFGDAWLTDLMQTKSKMTRLADRYRGLCAEAGTKPVVSLMRNAWIGPTREAVEEEWLDRGIEFYRGYLAAGARGKDDEVFDRIEAGEKVTHEDLARNRCIVGTPEFCIEEIKSWHEATGCDYMHLGFMGGSDPASLRAAIELFAKEVMPEFKD